MDPINLTDHLAALEQGANTGVKENAQPMVGAAFDLSKVKLFFPDGNPDWTAYISVEEPQVGVYFDTEGCNVFSGKHCSEMYMNALGSVPSKYQNAAGKAWLSVRNACIDTGVTNDGSSEAEFEAAIGSHGFIPEGELPWPYTQRTPVFDWDNFYTPETTQEENDGLGFLADYTPVFRAVGTDDASLTAALRYAPVKIFISIGTGYNTDAVVPKTSNPMCHAVTLRMVDSTGFHIYDHYPPYLKTLAPDYVIFYAYQVFLIPKGNPMPNAYIVTTSNGAGGTKEGVCVDYGRNSFIEWAADPAELATICARYGVVVTSTPKNLA
jgi:hypothetical protein